MYSIEFFTMSLSQVANFHQIRFGYVYYMSRYRLDFFANTLTYLLNFLYFYLYFHRSVAHSLLTGKPVDPESYQVWLYNQFPKALPNEPITFCSQKYSCICWNYLLSICSWWFHLKVLLNNNKVKMDNPTQSSKSLFACNLKQLYQIIYCRLQILNDIFSLVL